MKLVIKIVFTNQRELTMLLSKEEMDAFIECMHTNKPYYEKERKSWVGVPLYNVEHYNFFEYTEAMKKADEERAKELKIKAERDKAQAAAKEKLEEEKK